MRHPTTALALALALACSSSEKDPEDSAATAPTAGTGSGTPTTSTTGTPTPTGTTPTGTTPTGTPSTGTVTTDVDGDGYGLADGDCDDADPTVSPGALETFGDGVDNDCDGTVDRTPWATVGTWLAPGPPVVLVNTLDTVVTASAERFDDGLTGFDQAVLAFPLPLAGSPAPTLTSNWSRVQGGVAPDLPLGERIDAFGEGTSFFVGTGYDFVGVAGYNSVRRMDWAGVAYVAAATFWSQADPVSTTFVDTAPGSLGHAWSVACGPDRLIAMHADLALLPGQVPDSAELAAQASGVCFWEGTPDDTLVSGKLVSCAPGAPCETHLAEGSPMTLTASAFAPWSGEILRDARAYEDRVLVLDDQPGLRLYDGAFTRVLSDWTVAHADWSTRPGPAGTEHAVFFVGEPVVDDGLGPRLVLAWGPMDSLSTVTLDPTVPGIASPIVPTGVGVHLDANRMALAFSGTGPVDDTVAWAFYDL